MKVLMIEPGKAPYEAELDGSLESMQEAVGGGIEGGISMPEKPEKPSVLGKLSAAKEREKAAAEPKAPIKKKEDMQI